VAVHKGLDGQRILGGETGAAVVRARGNEELDPGLGGVATPKQPNLGLRMLGGPPRGDPASRGTFTIRLGIHYRGNVGCPQCPDCMIPTFVVTLAMQEVAYEIRGCPGV